MNKNVSCEYEDYKSWFSVGDTTPDRNHVSTPKLAMAQDQMDFSLGQKKRLQIAPPHGVWSMLPGDECVVLKVYAANIHQTK